MAGYRPKKRLGQNFLKSRSIIEKTIRLVDPVPGDSIVEIGAGRGALTLPLAETGVEVLAIEFDRDLAGYLTALLKRHDNAKVVSADFLGFEPTGDLLTGFKLVGNLPYNITSPVIDWCLDHHNLIRSAVFMVQKELGARLAASPGTRDWSPLSIFTGLYYRVTYCFEVAPEHFRPPPDVTSAVVQLLPLDSPPVVPTVQFQRVVRAAFRQRRKLLVNNLVTDVIPDSQRAAEILADLSLDRTARAESLTIRQFLDLTGVLIKRKLI